MGDMGHYVSLIVHRVAETLPVANSLAFVQRDARMDTYYSMEIVKVAYQTAPVVNQWIYVVNVILGIGVQSVNTNAKVAEQQAVNR